MVVKIRLARFGKKHAPIYNIVVAQARSARNSKPIEVLGTYDPIPKKPPFGDAKPFKDIQLDTSRAKYWLGVGAQPSDPAWRLLSMIGLMEPRFKVMQAKQEIKAATQRMSGGQRGEGEGEAKGGAGIVAAGTPSLPSSADGSSTVGVR